MHQPTFIEVRTSRFLAKTVLASLIVIVTNVAGNYALKLGVADSGIGPTWSPMPYIAAFSHLWINLGVLFMFGWFISRLFLLSWADLSYVMPITSFSYVLSAVAGAVLLGEQISEFHWIGIIVIALGVSFTAATVPDTTTQEGE